MSRWNTSLLASLLIGCGSSSSPLPTRPPADWDAAVRACESSTISTELRHPDRLWHTIDWVKPDCSEHLATTMGLEPGALPSLETTLIMVIFADGHTVDVGATAAQQHLSEPGGLYRLVTSRILSVAERDDVTVAMDIDDGVLLWNDDAFGPFDHEQGALALVHSLGHRMAPLVRHVPCTNPEAKLRGVDECDPHDQGSIGWEWAASAVFVEAGWAAFVQDSLYAASINP